MLFVELVLIRWTGSNVLYLSYFSNFILLGSFLGIGIGFLRSKSKVNLSYLAPSFLALFFLFVTFFPVYIDYTGQDFIHFGEFKDIRGLPQWVFLPCIFLIVTGIMAAIADGVARSFQKFAPLQAYRLDILGSLLGIIVFSLCSFSNASPFCWAVVITAVFISVLFKNWRLRDPKTVIQIFSLVLLMGTLGKEASTPGFLWSPYYKITVYEHSDHRYLVATNGIPHQIIESVKQRKKHEPFYFIPYQRMSHSTLDKVLIIGAGTGGDVAIALKEGAKQVDAVEIDPVIYHLGQILNSDQPYHDPRVHIFIGDGRAFLEKNKSLYDVIIFALPDSLTLVSGQSSLRLENYLFTSEAALAVKQHLKPRGVFAMYNYYREAWLVDRLANTLAKAFNYSPCLDTYGYEKHWLSVLTIGESPAALHCPTLWSPVLDQYATPSTDNHPFVYLKESHVPFIYLITLFFIFFTSEAAIEKLWAIQFNTGGDLDRKINRKQNTQKH